jgi:hypothetical protein
MAMTVRGQAATWRRERGKTFHHEEMGHAGLSRSEVNGTHPQVLYLASGGIVSANSKKQQRQIQIMKAAQGPSDAEIPAPRKSEHSGCVVNGGQAIATALFVP